MKKQGFGTTADGLHALGNAFFGVRADNAPNNTIGGLTSTPGTAAGNVISGNGGDGINATFDAITIGGLSETFGVRVALLTATALCALGALASWLYLRSRLGAAALAES